MFVPFCHPSLAVPVTILESGSVSSASVYHLSVTNLLSCCFLTKNVKSKTYKTIILPLVLYGCEICSLTLREGHILRVLGEQGAEENIWI